MVAGKRLCAVVAIALAALALSSASANADYSLGVYKVTGGKLVQKFEYQATSHTVDYGSGECWEYHYNSQGRGSFDLKPVAKARRKGVKGRVVKPAFKNGVFELGGLGWSGKVFRDTVINDRVEFGEDYDDECEPPDPPSQDTSGCGTDSVRGYVTPKLVPFRRGFPIIDNTSEPHHRMGLFGEMPQPLGLFPCPSESTFASLFNGFMGKESVSDVTLNAFERTKKRINLGGKDDYRGNQYFGFAGFEGGKGSQEASVRWKLELKCVDKCS